MLLKFISKCRLHLEERSWQIQDTGSNPTREEFLKALASPDVLLIPASYSFGKHTSRCMWFRTKSQLFSTVRPQKIFSFKRIRFLICFLNILK